MMLGRKAERKVKRGEVGGHAKVMSGRGKI
jgi:hypothetical protein